MFPPKRGTDPLVEMLIASTRATADALDRKRTRPTTEGLRRALLAELTRNVPASTGLRVRDDRAPSRDKTWRFSALIESTDCVLAAVEISADDDQLENQALALARLSLGLDRGIAERGFLVSASRHGEEPVRAPFGRGPVCHDGTLPSAIAWSWLSEGWQLVLTEARPSGGNRESPPSPA